ncbi:hypothetical protein SAMN05421882_11263, partial [Nitrosomonas communis]
SICARSTSRLGAVREPDSCLNRSRSSTDSASLPRPLFLAMFALSLSNRGIMAHNVKYAYVLMKLSTSDYSGEQTLGARCTFQELKCIFNSIDTPNAWAKDITEYEYIAVLDPYVCIGG